MKSFLKRILTFFGIILISAVMAFSFLSCNNDPGGNNDPSEPVSLEIPPYLKNTQWYGQGDRHLTIHETSLSYYRQYSTFSEDYLFYKVEYTNNGKNFYIYASKTGKEIPSLNSTITIRFIRDFNYIVDDVRLSTNWQEVRWRKETGYAYTVTQTGGAEGTADSTGIVFTFSASVDSLNLTAADITVGGAASKGSATLTGSGTSRTLSPITVNEAGQATVSIAKNGIEAATKSVIVYKAGQTTPEYWSITWYLNDGAEGTGEYPAQIEKGAVLAKPSPDPTKADNVFDGWYTDSALTQAYNFANPVTANLYLYAKWGQPPVEPPGPNSTLAEKLAWVLNENNVADGQTYTFEVSADENLSYQWLSYTNKSAITIILKSSGGEKIISLSQKGSLFSIGSGVTLVLDRNITLKGLLSDNYGPLVIVEGSGELIMNAGAKITDNLGSNNSDPNTGGGGVCVNNGTFTMNGGEISGNSLSDSAGTVYFDGSYGAGVYVGSGTFTMNGGKITDNKVTLAYKSHSFGVGVFVSKNGTFTMNGGEISANFSQYSFSDVSNSSSYGGGVCVEGTFIMKGGEISDNTITSSNSSYGGGVCVQQSGTFTMSGGKISGNTLSSYNPYNWSNNSWFCSYGGGVYVQSGTFTMTGGTISGNTAASGKQPYPNQPSDNFSGDSFGGGVCVQPGTFTKTGGTIYGYSASDTTNSNVVKYDTGVVGDYRGHAVYVRGVLLDNTDNKRRETTAGPNVNLDSSKDGVAGGWEN